MNPESRLLTPELPLAPCVEVDEVMQLERFLEGRGAWLTSTDILVMRDEIPSENNKRRLRALANRSDKIISGQHGYRHISHASTEEIHHFASVMRSQAKEMDERASAVLRAAHARIA